MPSPTLTPQDFVFRWRGSTLTDAYGWPHELTDEQILERLLALDHERAGVAE